MNYLKDPELESISLFLTERELNNTILNGKIEVYSIRTPIISILPEIPEDSCSNSMKVSSTDNQVDYQTKISASNNNIPDDSNNLIINNNNQSPQKSNNSNATINNNNDATQCNINNSNTLNMFDDTSNNNFPVIKKQRSRSNSYDFYPTRPKDVKRSSSLGDLSAPSSKQLFYNLISTLNESFPDYDFQSTKLDQFNEINVFTAMRSINNSLAELTTTTATTSGGYGGQEENNNNVPGNFLEKLWHGIDQCIGLRKCEVFSYMSDNEGDPFSQGVSLWSFNYFFFNAQKMRICYFTCVANSKYNLHRTLGNNPYDSEDDDDDEDDNDDDGSYVAMDTDDYDDVEIEDEDEGEDKINNSGSNCSSGSGIGAGGVNYNENEQEEEEDEEESESNSEEDSQLPDWEGII